TNPVVEEFGKALPGIHLERYPYWTLCIERYASYLGLNPRHVTLTPGSDDAIRMLFACVLPGTELIVTQYPNYENYFIYADCFGLKTAQVRFSPMQDPASFAQKLSAAIESHAGGCVVVANPHGFSGIRIPDEILLELIEHARRRNCWFI